MTELLHRCMTKVTTAEGDDIRYSLNWVISRRGILQVYSDRLVCGDWVIPYDEMDEAVLIRTRQMLIPCYVLRVKSKGRIYQFGLNPGRFWVGPLPFPVERTSAKLSYSWFSIGLRVAIVVGIGYLVWSSFGD